MYSGREERSFRIGSESKAALDLPYHPVKMYLVAGDDHNGIPGTYLFIIDGKLDDGCVAVIV